MRILLADEQDRVRHALKVLLAQQSGVEVAGEAAAAADLVIQMQAVQPEVVILDWELPGLTGLEGLAELRKVCPSAELIVLSSRMDDRKAVQAAKATVFICKSDPPEKLLTAVWGCQGLTA